MCARSCGESSAMRLWFSAISYVYFVADEGEFHDVRLVNATLAGLGGRRISKARPALNSRSPPPHRRQAPARVSPDSPLCHVKRKFQFHFATERLNNAAQKTQDPVTPVCPASIVYLSQASSRKIPVLLGEPYLHDPLLSPPAFSGPASAVLALSWEEDLVVPDKALRSFDVGNLWRN